jgi:hypothetical protein
VNEVVSVVVIADSNLFQILLLCFFNAKDKYSHLRQGVSRKLLFRVRRSQSKSVLITVVRLVVASRGIVVLCCNLCVFDFLSIAMICVCDFVTEFSFSDLIVPCSESVLEHIISWTISISGFWKLRRVSDFARLSTASTDT